MMPILKMGLLGLMLGAVSAVGSAALAREDTPSMWCCGSCYPAYEARPDPKSAVRDGVSRA